MTREKKNLRSRRRIIDSAIEEFGDKIYGEASINSICKRGEISKGIIYHYFKDKDDLYLTCVRESFDKLIEALNSKEYDFNIKKDIKGYLSLRHRFIQENPNYGNIFFNAVLHPPKHLTEEIREMKNTLDDLNINYYRQALKNVDLREDVSEEDAVEYFMMLQETFNIYFQNKLYDGLDIKDLIEEYEQKLGKILKIMLYGIAK